MNVNALLVDTLDSLLPTADSVYKGAATEYTLSPTAGYSVSSRSAPWKM